MLDYRLSKAEQEMTLTVCRSDDDVHVYASDRVFLRKLDGLCAEFPEVYRKTWTDPQILGDGLPMGAKYTFPRRYLRFGHPASAAQIEAARANAVKMRSTSQNTTADAAVFGL